VTAAQRWKVMSSVVELDNFKDTAEIIRPQWPGLGHFLLVLVRNFKVKEGLVPGHQYPVRGVHHPVRTFSTAVLECWPLNSLWPWRRTADGVSDPKKREASSQEFDGLLWGLVEDLQNWIASDILDVTETDLTE